MGASPVSAIGTGQLGWQTNRMGLVAHLGQLNLPLALFGAETGLLRQAVIAMRAADALLELWRSHIFSGYRMTAGMALIEGARCQVMPHGYPVIEYKTLALPFGLLYRHLFQVFQNAALEVVDLLEAFLEHKAGSLLTADAAGTEHGHFLVLLRIELLTH